MMPATAARPATPAGATGGSAVFTTIGSAPWAGVVDDPAGLPGRLLHLTLAARQGATRHERHVLVRIAPGGALPQGVAAARDLVVAASLRVEGCGVYSGGDVVGREHVALLGSSDDEAAGELAGTAAPDRLHPDFYSQAAVHAAGSIYAAGGEIHVDDVTDPEPEALAADTDAHTGEQHAAGLTALPDAVALAAFEQHAMLVLDDDDAGGGGDDGSGEPGGADQPLEAGVLHLERLPWAPPSGAASPDEPSSADPSAGYVVFVSASALPEAPSPLIVTGQRPDPPGACPVTLIVEGDATLVDAAFRGALLAVGSLTVAGPSTVHGSVAARELVVVAPLHVVLDDAWLDWPPAGCRTLEALRRW
jgi:hypothetical protein